MNDLAISKKYNICECESLELWNNLIKNAVNPSVVYLDEFLEFSKINHKKLFIRNKNEIIAGIPILCSSDFKDIIISNKIIYTPIIYKKKIFLNRSFGTINIELYNIISVLYRYLIDNFNSVDITFDYFTRDIRPFIWHNFYQPNEYFLVTPKFTSILDYKNINNKDIFNDHVLKNFSKTKRNEYRQASSSKLKIYEEITKKDIYKLMHDTFKVQGLDADKEYNLNTLIDLLQNLKDKDMLKFFCAKNESEELYNFMAISIINNSAQFLYSGRSSDHSNPFVGTFLHAEVIKRLLDKNITHIDLEGINSPKRSFFKIGFGGKIKTYYNLKLKKLS